MSADNITACPECKELALREWTDMGMSHDGILVIDYYCACKECGFEYSYHLDVLPEAA